MKRVNRVSSNKVAWCSFEGQFGRYGCALIKRCRGAAAPPVFRGFHPLFA
jgi:hypothetical protein